MRGFGHYFRMAHFALTFIGSWSLSGLFSTDDIGEVYAHQTLSEKFCAVRFGVSKAGSGAAAPHCVYNPPTDKVIDEWSLRS
jgi:hypothetical protein